MAKMNPLIRENGKLVAAPQTGEEEAGQQDPQLAESPATEEEQAHYDMLMLNANEFIHGKGKTENVLKQLKRYDQPSKAIGMLAAQISLMSVEAARRSKVKVDPIVAIQSNTEIVEELADVGAAAGIFKFQEGDPQYVDTVQRAMATSLTGFTKAAVAAELFDTQQLQDAVMNLQTEVGDENLKATVQDFAKLAPEVGPGMPAAEEVPASGGNALMQEAPLSEGGQ